MEKLNIRVANWFTVAGINDLQVNNEINAGLIFTNVCADILALNICSRLLVLKGRMLSNRLTERAFSIIS